MPLSHCFFAGIPSPTHWSQSFCAPKGHFFGIALRADSEEASILGRQYLEQIMERWSTEGQGNATTFLSLFLPDALAHLSLAAIYIEGERVILYAKGDADIMLTRGASSGIVLSGKNTGVYVEGKLAKHDTYIAGTREIFSLLHSLDLSRSPSEICDDLTLHMQSLPDSSSMCGVIVSDHPAHPSSVVPSLPPLHDQAKTTLSDTLYLLKMKYSLLYEKYVLSNPRRAKRLARRLAVFVTLVVAILALALFLTLRERASLASALAPFESRYQTLSTSSPTDIATIRGFRDLSRDLTARKNETKNATLARRYDTLLLQVNKRFAEISKERHIDKLDVFYDLRLVAPDFSAIALGFDIPGKLAVFLDSAHRRVLSLSIEKKEAQMLAVDERLSTPLALAVDARKAYILADNGVMQMSLPLDAPGSIILERNDSWVTPKALAAFTGNLYLLDSGARNLYRYSLDDPTASPSAWLKNKEGIEFDGLTSLLIDGEVFLGNTGGKIFRYAQGNKLAFDYHDVLDLPTSPISLYAQTTADYLYVLEPRESRLLVLAKDGTYKQAIVSPDLATATSVIVDEDHHTAYILAGSLVYQISLN